MRLASSQRTPVSRAEQLADALVERIQGENLQSGDPLGTVRDLCEWSGYSKPTVNEAIGLLRSRGFLIVKQGRGGGIFVANLGPAVKLRHTLLSVQHDAGVVADAIELREHLEFLISSNAAIHRTDSDVAEMFELLERMEAAKRWDRFIAANWALHQRIAEACRNTMARAVYIGTLGHLGGSHAVYADKSDIKLYLNKRFKIHQQLVEAIKEGDIAAVERAVKLHNSPRSVKTDSNHR